VDNVELIRLDCPDFYHQDGSDADYSRPL